MRGRRFKTQADIDHYVKQGFGQGEAVSYLPWIRVQDVPSRGRSRKTWGSKTQRLHHTLSDLEYGYFLLLEFSDEVIDIREQYPIFPTENTRKIAIDLGIRYPMYASTKLHYVMTSDFLVTIERGGKRSQGVRTCKYEQELADPVYGPRTIEKLELERAIWLSQGLSDWKVVTEKTVTPTLTDNLDWLRKSVKGEQGVADTATLQCFLDVIDAAADPERTLASVLRSAANASRLTYSAGVALFAQMVWTKAIKLDLVSKRIELRSACPAMQVLGVSHHDSELTQVA